MSEKKGMNRRSFLATAGVVSTGALIPKSNLFAKEESKAEYPRIKDYHVLGRTGFQVSDIGIGTSRVYSTPIISALLDAGVNYIDTAEGYGRGAAERNIAEAIKGRDRKSLFITTKIRMRGVTTKDQVIEKVNQCLERLETDYIDCLMNQGTGSIEDLKDENFHLAMDELKKQGKVRFVGTANHGSMHSGQGESMETILMGAVEDGRFDVLLVVYNFVQKDAGERIMAAAAQKDIGITIMKSDPLGRYFQMKERIEQMKKDGEPIDERTTQYMTRMEATAKQAESFIQENNLTNPSEIKEAALKFVLNNPKVHTLNLAFNTFDDIHNYLKLSGTRLKETEKAMLSEYKKNCGQLYCRHACGICEPECPHQVPVNTIMRYSRYFDAQSGEKYAMGKYARLETAKADRCKNCEGFCEKSCPFGVPIQGLLAIAHSELTLV